MCVSSGLLVVTGIEGIDEAVDQFGAADDFQTFKSEQPEHPCSPAFDERDVRQIDRDVLSASQSSLALRLQDRYPIRHDLSLSFHTDGGSVFCNLRDA